MTRRRRPPLGQARQLPVPIPPALNETLDSCVRRLAAANHIPVREFEDHLDLDLRSGRSRQQRLGARSLARLAVITGCTPAQLALALPEIDGRDGDPARLSPWRRPACPACTRHHLGGAVTRFYPPHVHTCPKHQRWISGARYPRSTVLDISGTPVVLAAQSKHRRLARRHGPQRTQYAFGVAREFWNNLFGMPTHSGVTARLAILHPDWTSGPKLLVDDPEFLAASYPNVVSTAALLVSPHWRRIAAKQRTRKQFLDELSWRMTGEREYSTPPRFWPGRKDPIAEWIDRLSRDRTPWPKASTLSFVVPQPEDPLTPAIHDPPEMVPDSRSRGRSGSA